MADTDKAAKIAELEARLAKVRRVKELEARLAEVRAKKETLPESVPVETDKPPEESPGFFANFIKGAKQGLTKDIPRQASVLSSLASGKAKDEVPIPVEQSEPFKIMSPSTWSRKGAGQFLGRGLASSIPAMGATLGGATAGAAAGSVVPGVGTLIGGLAGAAIGAGVTAGAQTLADFYNEARTRGASHEEALEAAKSAGYTSGAINALAAPLGGVGLSKTLTQPGIKSLAGYAGKQAGIQGTAGGADVMAQNAIAQGSFAPERELTEGLPEAVAAGAAFQGLPIAMAAPKLARAHAGKTALELSPEPAKPRPEIIPEAIKTPVTPEIIPENVPHEIKPTLSESPIEPVDTKLLGEKIFGSAEEEKTSLVSKAKETIADLIERPGLKAETALFDFLAPVKHAGIEGEGYRLERENLPFRAAKSAQHITGIVEASLLHGTPEWNKEQVGFQQKPNSKGMLEILEPALKDKNSKDAFGTYAYARRVKTQELVAQGKEKNITASEAENAIRQLEAEYPEFKETFNELQDYNKSLLDAAEATGIINKEGREVWAQEDYTPFFRKTEAEKGKLLGGKKKLAGQKSPIKKLTGGSEKYAVFEDGQYKGRYDTEAEARDASGTGQIYPVGPETANMYENLATNATSLIERSQRNGAALSILEHAEKAGIAEPTTYEGTRPKDVVQVMKDGKEAHYKISDPLLYNALENTLNPKKKAGPILTAIEKMKDIVSRSIMSTPKTMFNVAVKDAIFSRAMGKEPMVPLIQSVKDFGESLKHQFSGQENRAKASQDIIDMMFMGNDTTFYQNKPKNFVEKVLERVEKQDKKEGSKTLSVAEAIVNPKKWFATLEKLGRAAELSTRMGKYRAAQKAGANKFEAGFEAMDYLNYANRGSSDFVQLLGQTVPFFNAHMAGIHKLARELKYNDPKMKLFRNRTIKIGSVIAAFSMANMINNLREDESEEDAANNYLSLPDYLKTNNIMIDLYKIPGMEKSAIQKSGLERWVKIPKPWEIGQLFSSIPEQFILKARGDKDWNESLSYLIDSVSGTLSINPFGNPIIKTGMEQYQNKKFFTGQPIVPRSRENLEPELQYGPGTSSTSKAVGKATGLSPDRLEHAATGLLGPAYLWPTVVTDLIIDTFSANKKPAKKLSERDFFSTFTASSPQRSAYQEELYEMSKEADKAYDSLKTYHKLGEEEKAEKYIQKKGPLLESRGLLNKMKKEVKGFEDEINHIRDDESLSGKEKRVSIDELTKQKNNLLYNFKQMKKEIKP